MTFFRILNFYNKWACGAFPEQTTVSLLSLWSDFRIIAEKRVLVLWNLVWLHFLRDTYTLVRYCQLKSQFFPRNRQTMLWKWCPPFLAESSLLKKLFSCKNFLFYFLELVVVSGALEFYLFCENFLALQRQITLLVRLQRSSAGVSVQHCMSKFLEQYKQTWVDHHVSVVLELPLFLGIQWIFF